MSMVPTLLSVEGLSKSYGGVHAVRGVSFELRAGEILALIGPNGAGKSTTVKMIIGMVEASDGRIVDQPGAHSRAGNRFTPGYRRGPPPADPSVAR